MRVPASSNEQLSSTHSLPSKTLGYSLTGETSEKVVFVAHGTGNNGKSTLLETVRQIVPEYSAKILIESLMVKPGRESANTLTDLADLRGARFAAVSAAWSSKASMAPDTFARSKVISLPEEHAIVLRSALVRERVLIDTISLLIAKLKEDCYEG
jgi:energy-coupling factor transporter ATP-binding protein EcfA2